MVTLAMYRRLELERATMTVKRRLAATERNLIQRFDKLDSSIEEASY